MNIIIIGASGRIGTELTLYLLRQGHNLALGDLYSGQIKNTIQSSKEPLNNKIFIQDIDMCSEDDYEQWLSNANSKLGLIDGAINCSYPRGKNYGVRLEDVTLETFNNNVSMHLGSYFNFLKATSSFMKSHCFSGPIICTSSIYGHMAPKFSIYEKTNMTMPIEYAAVKSSINHLIRYFASFYSGVGLRFNAISPGGILDNQAESFISAYREQSLNKGLLDAMDIVPLLEFMLSKNSEHINGQIITIDDGFSL